MINSASADKYEGRLQRKVIWKRGREPVVRWSGWRVGGCSGEIAPSEQGLVKELGIV